MLNEMIPISTLFLSYSCWWWEEMRSLSLDLILYLLYSLSWKTIPVLWMAKINRKHVMVNWSCLIDLCFHTYPIVLSICSNINVFYHTNHATMTTGTEIDLVHAQSRRGPKDASLALIHNPTGDSGILLKDFMGFPLCDSIHPDSSDSTDCFAQLTHVMNTISSEYKVSRDS